MTTRTYYVEVVVEVTMTRKGRPATGPSYASGGEPAEGPEFETGDFYVSKATIKPSGVASFGSRVAEALEEAALEQAREDDWSDE